MFDIRNHGGVFGGNSIRKGITLPVTSFTEPVFPKVKTANAIFNGSTSSGSDLSYDIASGELIGTSYNNNNSARVTRMDSTTLDTISTTIVSSDFSGSNPSTYLKNVVAYVSSGTPRYYINFYRYQNGISGVTEIRVHNASTGALMQSISSTGADFIFKITETYVIYYSAYYCKVCKLDFTSNIVTVLLDMSSLYGVSASSPGKWAAPLNYDYVWFFPSGSTNFHVYTKDATFVNTVTGSSFSASTMYAYHNETDTFLRIRYTYASNGGHYFETINKITGATITSTRLSTYGNVSIGENNILFYDIKNKSLMCQMNSANGIKITVILKIKSDGTIVNWDFSQSGTWIDYGVAKYTPSVATLGKCVDLTGRMMYAQRWVSTTWYVDSYTSHLTISK